MVLDELLKYAGVDLPDLINYPLPKGLSGLYHQFLTRELGKDERRWFEIFEPLLGLIGVAQGAGLTTQQLTSIIGKDIRPALRVCMQYLSGELPEGPFRLFHKSFVDFLLEDKANSDYRIDAGRMHQRIASHYLSVGYANWYEVDSYGLAHLADHLFGGRMSTELTALCSEVCFVDALLNGVSPHAAVELFTRSGDLTPETQFVSQTIVRNLPTLGSTPTQLLPLLLSDVMDVDAQWSIGLRDRIHAAVRTSPHLPQIWMERLNRCCGREDRRLITTIRTNTSKLALASPSRNKVLFSSDSLKMIVLSESGELQIFATDSWRPFPATRLTAFVQDAAVLSLESRECIVLAYGGKIEIRTIDLQHCVRSFDSDHSIRTIAASSVARLIAVGTDGGHVTLWNVDGQRLKAYEVTSQGRIDGIEFSPDGSLLLCYSCGGNVAVLIALSSEKITLRLHGYDMVDCARFSPDGRLFAVSDAEDDINYWSTITVYDVESKAELNSFVSRWVHDFAFSPNSHVIAAASQDGLLKIWDFRQARGPYQKTIQFEGHYRGLRCANYSPDGRLLASMDDTETIKVWQGNGAQVNADDESVGVVCWSPDGLVMASGGHMGTVCVWNAENGTEIAKAQNEEHMNVLALAISADSRSLVVGFYLHTLSILSLPDLKNQRRTRILGKAESVAFAPGLPYVVVGLNREMDILHVGDSEVRVVKKIHAHDHEITALQVSPDGKWIASGGGWASHPRVMVHRFWEDHQAWSTVIASTIQIKDLAFSADSRHLAAACNDRMVRVFSVVTGIEEAQLDHPSAVLCVAFSPCGSKLATGCADFVIRIWSLKDLTVKAFFPIAAPVKATRFSADGSELWASDGFARPRMYRFRIVERQKSDQ